MSIKEKIARWFGIGQPPATREYVNIPYGQFGANYQKRPIFSTYWADLMAMDQQVWFGTAIGNAPLLSAEVEVEGPSNEVNEFVGQQWDKIWSTSAAKILKIKQYGAGGFEVDYHVTDGCQVEFKELLDRHPRDTTPLLRAGELAGVRFQNVKRSHATGAGGRIDLRPPRGLWLTYCAEHGSNWGRALYERAYGPWYEKAMDGGATELRRLRMVKDAWMGDSISYPMFGPLSKFTLPSGQEVTARDMAREIAENRASGGLTAIPSDCDPNTGKPYFEYKPPTNVSGATQILEWIHDLDWDVLDGLLVPREVVEAATTGSGFSGRSIPFLSFLGMRDLEFADDVRQIDKQVLRWLVAAKFGVRASKQYEIRPKPLIETVGKQMGPMGKPETSESSMGQDGGRPDQPLRPATPDGPNRPPMHGNAAMQFSVGSHSYASTQINLPEQLAEKVRKLAAAIPRADLAADGREDEPHVTVKYGLHVDDPTRVAELLRGAGLVHVTIGETSVFNCADYDVVKLNVESEDLHRLNERISDSIPCTDTHPEYVPHITLAYVKPGMGQKYAGPNSLTGVSFSSEQVIFSNTSGERSMIPLSVLATLQFAIDTEPTPADRIATKASAAGAALVAGIPGRIDRLLKKNDQAGGLLTGADWLAELESLIRELQDPLAQSIYDASVSAWVGGASDQLDSLPEGAPLPVSIPPTPPPPTPPAPPAAFPAPEGEPPPVRLTAIDRAVKKLQGRAVVSADEYAELSATAKQQAFSIAGDLTDATIGRIHEILTDNVHAGASLKDFRAAVADSFETSPIGEAHLEQVYRNAVNESYSQGMETVLDHPMVADAFPYRMYVAIHDARARHEHRALESLGLNGTAVYFADDPTWGRFRPPWSFNCRCGWIPLDIEDAARHGVQHARDWLAAIERAKKSGIYDGNPASVEPPRQWVKPPPFSPPAGWDRR